MPEPGRSGGAFAQPILLTLDYVKLMSRKKNRSDGRKFADLSGFWSEGAAMHGRCGDDWAKAEPALAEKGQPCTAAAGTGQYFRGVGVRACLL